MKKITVDELVNLLLVVKENTLAEIKTLTDPKLRKTNNPYAGEIMKESVGLVVLNYNYEKEVNRQRAREGEEFDFQTKARTWGTRMGESSLITHNGFIYVDVNYKESKETKFLHNGEEIEKVLIEEWLPKKKSNSGRQKVDKEVVSRTIKVGSIVEIKIDGVNYSIN